jgi:hypothetical protein
MDNPKDSYGLEMQAKARMMHVNAMSFGLSMLEYCIYSVYSGGSTCFIFGPKRGGRGKPDRVLKLARFAELISSHVHTRLLRWAGSPKQTTGLTTVICIYYRYIFS